MERLQIAIEKARTERNRALSAEPAAGPASPAEVAAEPAPAVPGSAWDELKIIALAPKVLRRNRVITAEADPRALAFDHLRTRIVQQSRRQGWRRIAVVSPHAGAGKTTLVANLSFCLGRQQDLKTIVFDFDLRRMGLGKALGQSLKTTMGGVILGEVPFSEHALRYGDNLAFGLNGRNVRNPSELLQSGQTAEMLSEIETTYAPDMMLFDMPPLLAADDALGFLRQVDAALIVVEAERTPLSQVDIVESHVAEITNVLGMVLNRCNYASELPGDYGTYGSYPSLP